MHWAAQTTRQPNCSGSWKTPDLLNGNAGDDKPAEVVRSRLKKLNADHIRFVLGSLEENTAPVRNMKQYLLAMLYNAPTTMNLYRVSESEECP